MKRFLYLLPIFIFLLSPILKDLLNLNIGNLYLLRGIMEKDSLKSQKSTETLSSLNGTRFIGLAHRSLANQALLLENNQQALEHALQSVQLRPNDQLAQDLLGKAYWASGDYESAREVWQKNGLLEPRLEQLSFRGWESFNRGDYAAGIANFQKGIELDPSWPWGYWAISGYYWDIQEVDRARPYLEQAARLFPQGSPEQLFVSGRLSLLDGNQQAAREQFCTALRLEPQSWFLDGCLWVLWAQGDFNQGWQVIQSTAQTHPEWALPAAETWGDRLFEEDLAEQALRFYQIACPEPDPDSRACTKYNEGLQTVPQNP